MIPDVDEDPVTAVQAPAHHDPAVDAWLRPVLYAIRLSFLPIIVAGTVTNCLNFVVLSRREMRSVSTSVYLFALAVADLGVMYLELFRIWFEWAQVAIGRLLVLIACVVLRQ